jgi:rRNA maturation endonuclease Nob1
MKKYYCWKCEQVLPFFEENEWANIEDLLSKRVKEIKEFRQSNECDLNFALDNLNNETALKLEGITEIPVKCYNSIYHHRLADWGDECKKCGHLFRTKEALFCANCGEKKYA